MTPSPALENDLQQGFEAFVEASRRLEESHAALVRRAEAIDVELATTNRALEQALGEREAILQALPVGVLATAPGSGEVRWTNPEGQRLRDAARALGVDLTRLTEGESEHGSLCVAVRRADLPDGGTLVVVEDRAPLVRLSREVDRLDRLAGLSELALGIAHEIKNPLNGVMGFAALMQRSQDPDQLVRYAAKVHTGLAQVDGIVREMLAFATTPARSSTGARAPLRAVAVEAAAAAGLPQSRLELRGDIDTPVDTAALTRVLANLLRNSAEAGGGEISITAAVLPDHVELLVADDGPGVAAELGQRVFEPFVSSKERGHGLGLALASRVMSFLGGSLELTNPGQPGAVFRLTLSRRRGAGAPA